MTEKTEIQKLSSEQSQALAMSRQKLTDFTLMLRNNESLISCQSTMDMTIEKAVDGVQLSFIKNDSGEKVAVAFLSRCLTEPNKYFPSSFDAGMITMASQMILRNYWYMKAEEVLLVFKEGIFGKYGKVYGQINFPVIAQWFEAHDAERSGLFEANHETKKGELNGSNHDRKAPLLTNSFDDMVRDEANKKANFFMKKRTENEEGEK